MEIQVFSSISDINVCEWEQLMKSSPFSNFFQSKQCYEFYNKTDFLNPFVFGVLENHLLKGIIVGYIQSDGGIIKSYFSRRAIINAGPLLASDISDEALFELLSVCKKDLQKKAIYIEIRNFFDYSCYKATFEKVGFYYKQHLNFQIDTSSEEIVMQNMGKSRKRDIKVTLRDGASMVENPTEQEVEQYYSILTDLYKKKVKTPLFPLNFFVELFKYDYAHFLFVKYDDKIIGGTVCVGFPGTPLYEWFACGEDGLYKNIHASTLATFGGIRYACHNEHPIFDMMGAGTPEDSYGVRDFKAKFGGKLVENGRFLCTLNPFLFRLGKLGIKIIKKL